MKRFLTVLAIACFAITVSAAGDTELTLSGSAFNAKEGATVWSAAFEPLFKLGPLHVGPSVAFVDTGDSDGGSFGVAAELNTGKYGGLFVGGRLGKNTGDLSDLAEYTGEVRAGFKLGDAHAAIKVYAAQTWSRDAAGATSDPDGTSVNVGLLIRK